MTNNDLYEIDEYLNNEINEEVNPFNTKKTKRRWREIENFKENKRLHRELLEYS